MRTYYVPGIIIVVNKGWTLFSRNSGAGEASSAETVAESAFYSSCLGKAHWLRTFPILHLKLIPAGQFQPLLCGSIQCLDVSGHLSAGFSDRSSQRAATCLILCVKPAQGNS